MIPTRNRRSELERAIESVHAQTLSDWELVVVDDASSDGTQGYLSSLRDPRVHVVRLDEHLERSAARNRGLEVVSSQHVLFLDDDDELFPGALELLTRSAAGHPEACAAVGAVIHDTDGARSRPSFPKHPIVNDVRLELLAGWVALGGQSLFRTSLLNELGGWQVGLSVAEDQELWLRICARGPVAIVPEAVLVHRPHGVAGDAPGGRDVEREVVSRYLVGATGAERRARRAAAAREHLRDGDIAFKRGAYRRALLATVKGILAAPFLLASPLIGGGLRRGLLNAVVAAMLPRPALERLRAAQSRRRTRSLAPH